MGRAGIVLGLEVSRLARNNADWHRLLEICAMSGTLICDEDGLYDPADFNDRLLLGLKGTMSEAELHFIRARLRRRAAVQGPPRRTADGPAGRAGLRPRRQGRARPRCRRAAGDPRTCSPLFARTGSARAVVQQFNTDGLLFPVRVAHRRPQGRAGLDAAAALAGAAHPAQPPLRRRVRLRPPPRTPAPPTARRADQLVPREQWIALIPDAHPGYISWDQYETNQQLLLGNATAHGADRAAGPAREGTALLQGLAICGRCGRRMTRALPHPPRRRSPRLPMHAPTASKTVGRAAKPSPAPSSTPPSAQLLLDTLTPLALEVALTVQAELETRAAEADALRRSHVERARHRADLARRRYLAVDPDNRLVADSLEADWNDALRALQTAQRGLRQAPAPPPQPPSPTSYKDRIHALAADFPALWSNPHTPQRDRKRMVRLLIEDVTLHKTDRIHLHVRFRGGQTPASSSRSRPHPGSPPNPPRHPRRARPAPRHPHRRRNRRRAQRRRSPLRRGQAVHRRHRRHAPPQVPSP